MAFKFKNNPSNFAYEKHTAQRDALFQNLFLMFLSFVTYLLEFIFGYCSV